MIRRLWTCAPLLLAMTMLAWAGNTVIARAIADAVPPVLLAFLRWSGACAVVTACALPALRRDLRPMLRAWPAMLALALAGIAAYNTLVYRALHDTTALNALLLQSTTPLFIVVWDWLLFRRGTTASQAAAILVSLIGVVVIAGRGSPATLAALSFNPGDMMVLLAIALYALYSSLLRLRPAVHPMSFLSGSFALGALMLLPLTIWEQRSGAALHLSVPVAAGIAYICLVPSFLAYLFFNRGVELIGAARAGQYLHLMPVFGTALAVLLLGERLHGFHLAGIALIAAGLALASRAPRPRMAAAAVRPR